MHIQQLFISVRKANLPYGGGRLTFLEF